MLLGAIPSSFLQKLDSSCEGPSLVFGTSASVRVLNRRGAQVWRLRMSLLRCSCLGKLPWTNTLLLIHYLLVVSPHVHLLKRQRAWTQDPKTAPWTLGADYARSGCGRQITLWGPYSSPPLKNTESPPSVFPTFSPVPGWRYSRLWKAQLRMRNVCSLEYKAPCKLRLCWGTWRDGDIETYYELDGILPACLHENTREHTCRGVRTTCLPLNLICVSVCRFCLPACSVPKLCLTLATLWAVAHQASLSMGFSRQQHWSGLPFPYSRGSSPPRDWTCVSCISRQILYH